MTDVPHFSYPFRFGSPSAAVTEQDSIEEITDCCVTTLLCPVGFRVELPEFGIVDPTFSMPRVDQLALRMVVERWEPRASILLDQYHDSLDELITHVEALIQVRTGD